MSKEELIEVQGKVIDNLPQGKFKVELDGGHTVVAHVSGKMRIPDSREDFCRTGRELYGKRRQLHAQLYH